MKNCPICESIMIERDKIDGIKSLYHWYCQVCKKFRTEREIKMIIIGLRGPGRVGKDTVAEVFENAGFKHLAFADKVKDVATDLFGWDGKKDEAGRELLIKVGDWGRSIDPLVWIKHIEKQIKSNDDKIIISDVRYPNEADWIHSKGGFVINILPSNNWLPNEGFEKSPSETAMDNYPYQKYDIIITSTKGDIEGLQYQANQILKNILEVKIKY